MEDKMSALKIIEKMEQELSTTEHDDIHYLRAHVIRLIGTGIIMMLGEINETIQATNDLLVDLRNGQK